jgi:hypothetical protein
LFEFNAENITLIATIIGAAGFIIRLEAKVNQLEKAIENHPLLAAYRQIQNRKAITAVEKLLDDWRGEKEDN